MKTMLILASAAFSLFLSASPVRSSMSGRSISMSEHEQVTPWWLCFASENDGSLVSMVKTGSPYGASLECSTDGGLSWSPFDSDNGLTVVHLDTGDIAYVRASGSGNLDGFNKNGSNYRRFVTSGNLIVAGHIMSLIDGRRPHSEISASCRDPYGAFSMLFLNSTIVDASALVLPDDTCINLYLSTFQDCANLVYAPVLPSKRLTGRQAYYGMFLRCRKLVGPVFIMLEEFDNSSNQMAAMFHSCNSLDSVSIMFKSWPDGTGNWMYGVKSTGVFSCPAELGSDETILRGASNCPTNWDVENF